MRDQVGLQRDGRLELLGDHAVELATADRQVGVAEVPGVLLGQDGRHPVGPAAQAVGGVWVGVADALGEGVAQGDVAVERHGDEDPGRGKTSGYEPRVGTRVPGKGRLGAVVLLSDRDILAELDAGRITMEPYDATMMQPSSIDVRLDRYFRVFENHRYPHIDPAADQSDLTRVVEPEGDEPFILHPGEFVLGSTYEAVTLPDDIAARVEGKSSLGRLGLLTHATAGFVDPGFSGHVTLELANVATLPIKLYPGMKIGQFCFFRLSSASQHPYGSAKYGSRYQGQRGPTPSKSYQNFHRTRGHLHTRLTPPEGDGRVRAGWWRHASMRSASRCRRCARRCRREPVCRCGSEARATRSWMRWWAELLVEVGLVGHGLVS